MVYPWALWSHAWSEKVNGDLVGRISSNQGSVRSPGTEGQPGGFCVFMSLILFNYKNSVFAVKI